MNEALRIVVVAPDLAVTDPDDEYAAQQAERPHSESPQEFGGVHGRSPRSTPRTPCTTPWRVVKWTTRFSISSR